MEFVSQFFSVLFFLWGSLSKERPHFAKLDIYDPLGDADLEVNREPSNIVYTHH
jgi:hypothetical protein